MRYVKKPVRCRTKRDGSRPGGKPRRTGGTGSRPARVAAGKSNSEIAAALYLSVATVKTHVSRLLDKLGCRDRAQLVVVAYETGVAIPGRQLR